MNKELLEAYLMQAEGRLNTAREACKSNPEMKKSVIYYLGQVQLLRRMTGRLQLSEDEIDAIEKEAGI